MAATAPPLNRALDAPHRTGVAGLRVHSARKGSRRA